MYGSRSGSKRPRLIAVDLDGEVLALGVTLAKPMMTLYRVQGDTGIVEPFNEYPGMEPSTLAVAPDGTVYIGAFSARRLNRITNRPDELPSRYGDRLLHQLNDSGEVVRSFGSFSAKPDSAQGIGDLVFEVAGRRPVFSPNGSLYLLDSQRLELERVDLDSGELTGRRFRLATGRESVLAQVNRLQFVDEHTIVYTVTEMDEAKAQTRRGLVVAAPISGWEVRVANLRTGRSDSVTAGSVEGFAAALYSPESGEVSLFRLFGPTRETRIKSWNSNQLTLRVDSSR